MNLLTMQNVDAYGSISVIQNEKAVPEERYLYVDLRILYVIQRRYGSVVYHHEKL